MWAVLISMVMAAFGDWKIAGFLLILAVALTGLLALGIRRGRPKPRRDGAAPSDQG